MVAVSVAASSTIASLRVTSLIDCWVVYLLAKSSEVCLVDSPLVCTDHAHAVGLATTCPLDNEKDSIAPLVFKKGATNLDLIRAK